MEVVVVEGGKEDEEEELAVVEGSTVVAVNEVVDEFSWQRTSVGAAVSSSEETMTIRMTVHVDNHGNDDDRDWRIMMKSRNFEV